jgi:aryl-alcohol dehydrogenase-like predicted oxidoreductase
MSVCTTKVLASVNEQGDVLENNWSQYIREQLLRALEEEHMINIKTYYSLLEREVSGTLFHTITLTDLSLLFFGRIAIYDDMGKLEQAIDALPRL